MKKYRVTIFERSCSMHFEGLDIYKRVFEIEAGDIEEAMFKVLDELPGRGGGILRRAVKIDIKESNLVLVLHEDSHEHVLANWKDIEEE